MSNPSNSRVEIATRLLAGLLANPGGPLQQRADMGWGFINCTSAMVVDLALELADDLINVLATTEGES